MTYRVFSLALFAFSFALCGIGFSRQQNEPKATQSESAASDATQQESAPPDGATLPQKYNADLARQLGADEYGMKSFVFVLLKTGNLTIQDQEESRSVFAGHFANMGRLAEEGKLVLAGPLVDGEPKRGIFVLNVTTIKEAEDLVRTDPAVKAGVFDYELTKLYCSAALMKIRAIHETVQKTRIE